MANLTITDNDVGNVILADAKFRREILALAGADTILEGTILARRKVSSTIADGVAGGEDVGDGVCDACALYGNIIVPKIGAYVLECTAEVGNGGVWSLSDPSGVELLSGITMTPGAGVTTIFNSAGLGFTFSLTDGSEDFDTGDTFTITIVADGDLVPLDLTGEGGAQFPLSVLTYEVVVAAQADVAIRAMVSGSVRKEKLVIDGLAAGVSINDAIIDALREVGIIAINVEELNIEDND